MWVHMFGTYSWPGRGDIWLWLIRTRSIGNSTPMFIYVEITYFAQSAIIDLWRYTFLSLYIKIKVSLYLVFSSDQRNQMCIVIHYHRTVVGAEYCVLYTVKYGYDLWTSLSNIQRGKLCWRIKDVRWFIKNLTKSVSCHS